MYWHSLCKCNVVLNIRVSALSFFISYARLTAVKVASLIHTLCFVLPNSYTRLLYYVARLCKFYLLANNEIITLRWFTWILKVRNTWRPVLTWRFSYVFSLKYSEELYFELFGWEFSILSVSSRAQRSHGWRGESLLHTHIHTPGLC